MTLEIIWLPWQCQKLNFYYPVLPDSDTGNNMGYRCIYNTDHAAMVVSIAKFHYPVLPTEIGANGCQSSPCIHGYCSDTDDGFECLCHDDWAKGAGNTCNQCMYCHYMIIPYSPLS